MTLTNSTEALVLAGGFGTRLQSIVNNVPKPMAPINDQPFFILSPDIFIPSRYSTNLYFPSSSAKNDNALLW